MDNNTILYAEPDRQRTAQDPGAAEEPRAAAALRPLAPGTAFMVNTSPGARTAVSAAGHQ